MKIRYSRHSQKWLKQHNVCREKLSAEIATLCRRFGRISHRKIYIHIKRSGFDSEFDCRGNKLTLGNFAIGKHSERYKVKCVLVALLHELRHFIQMRVFFFSQGANYSTSDIVKNNSRYYNDPAEVDARRFERKHIKKLLRSVYIKR